MDAASHFASFGHEPKKHPGQDTHMARRRRLPDERRSITHKFQIGKHQGYINVGLYDDGNPGEVFLTMSKEGSVISGLVDAFATSISIGLQYGVPLKVFVNKFAHMRFEPSGETQNPNLPYATSIVDYIFRWLALKFLPPEERQAVIQGDPAADATMGGDFSATVRERQVMIGFESME
jgi:ribonucleoside-diphosphate reductase alpha chain